MTIRPASPDDVLVWPDGHWCLRAELAEHGHGPDDWYALAWDSPECEEFLSLEGIG